MQLDGNEDANFHTFRRARYFSSCQSYNHWIINIFCKFFFRWRSCDRHYRSVKNASSSSDYLQLRRILRLQPDFNICLQQFSLHIQVAFLSQQKISVVCMNTFAGRIEHNFFQGFQKWACMSNTQNVKHQVFWWAADTNADYCRCVLC